VVAVVTPLAHHYDADTDSDLGIRLKPPSSEHLFGTDSLGRDILVRVIHAARISLGLGISSVVVAAAIGSLLGLVAGYVGRTADLVIMFAWTFFSRFRARC
jgi:peptide/nickel transport system permease protein